MRFAFLFLLLIFISAAQECISCEEFANRPQANMVVLLDKDNYILEANVYYENISQSTSRMPVSDSTLIVEMTNSSGFSRVYRIYTDGEGHAEFNFNDWSDGCMNFKVVYCPFCNPDENETACGFAECLRFASINSSAGAYQGSFAIEDAGDIENALGSVPPMPHSSEKFLANLEVVNYCQPPGLSAKTPAMCLPLIIIFSLLAGALYMTGVNPFGVFNIGSTRMGKHMRYQARGRGYSLDFRSVYRAAKAIAGAAETISDKGLSEGLKEIARADNENAKENIIFGKEINALKKGFTTMSIRSRAGSRLKGASVSDALRGRGESSRPIVGPDGRVIGGSGGARGIGSVGITDLIVKADEGETGIKAAFMTAGKIAVYFFASSTIGEMIGDIYKATTKKDLVNDFLVDHEARTQNDLIVLDALSIEMKGEYGGLMANGAEITKCTRTYDDNGNLKETTFDIVVDAGKDGYHDGKTEVTDANGVTFESEYRNIQVTMDKDGTVTQISYNMLLPGEKEPSVITVNADGSVTATQNGEARVIQDQAFVLGTYQKFKEIYSDMDVGSDASAYIKEHDHNVEILNSIELNSSLSNELSNRREDVRDYVKEQTEYNAIIAAAKTKSSDQAIALLAGEDPNKRPDILQKYGDTEQAVRTFAKEANEVFGDTGRESIALSREVSSQVKLSDPDKELFQSATNYVISNTRYADLTSMDADYLKKEISSVLSASRVDADTIARIGDSITPGAANVISQKTTEFVKELEGHNVTSATINAVISSNLSEVSRTITVGENLTNNNNLLPFLHGSYDKLPDDLRQKMREATVVDSMHESSSSMAKALDQGDYRSMWKNFDDLKSKNSSYIDMSVNHLGHQNGVVSDDAYKVGYSAADDMTQSYRVQASSQHARQEVEDAVRRGDSSTARAVLAEEYRKAQIAREGEVQKEILENMKRLRAGEELSWNNSDPSIVNRNRNDQVNLLRANAKEKIHQYSEMLN